MALSVIFRSIKGDNLVKIHHIDMAFDKNIGLVMINKFGKFHENNLNGPEVMTETCCKLCYFTQ